MTSWSDRGTKSGALKTHRELWLEATLGDANEFRARTKRAYEDMGRGAWLIWEPDERYVVGSVHYVAALAWRRRFRAARKLHACLETYDPDREIVLAFVNKATGTVETAVLRDPPVPFHVP